MNPMKQYTFPIVTKEKQIEFEHDNRNTSDNTPDICGYYGRACRCLDNVNGANSALCNHCPLAEYAASTITILHNVDSCTPLSIRDSRLRVDWYNADEGICGDYNPENPDDVNLLRFDVYVSCEPEAWDDSDEGWREIEDASYCTNIPATASPEILERAIRYIFDSYRDVIDEYPYRSVKKLGEELSWISEGNFMI